MFYLSNFFDKWVYNLLNKLWLKVGMRMIKNNFYIFNEYMKKEDNLFIVFMEDYFEMIYRLFLKIGFIRIYEIFNVLNV